MPFARIVFMQGDEGREVVDALTNTEGVVAHGATADESIPAAIDHLSQWDNGEPYDDVHDEPAAGSSDETAELDGYILTWNVGLGYVGLERRLDDAEVTAP